MLMMMGYLEELEGQIAMVSIQKHIHKQERTLGSYTILFLSTRRHGLWSWSLRVWTPLPPESRLRMHQYPSARSFGTLHLLHGDIDLV